MKNETVPRPGLPLVYVTIAVALLLLTGCPPDEEPIVDEDMGIQAPDLSEEDAAPDMRVEPDTRVEPDMRRMVDMRVDRDMQGQDMNRPDMGEPVPEPEAEPSEPTASATAMVDDPATATTVMVTAQNLDGEPRMLRLGVTTSTPAGTRSAEEAATMVQPGARTTASFDLRTIDIVPSTRRFPARIVPRIIVEDSTGALVERIYGDAIEVGPALGDGFDALLRAYNLQAADVPTDGFGNFQAVLAAGEESESGLEPVDLQGPGEDEGPELPTPNYADGVPDANGNYQYDICLRWPVNWVDAGFGEDYGVQPEGTWRARGSRAHVLADGDVLFDDWLNADGCTGTFDSPTKTDLVVVAYSAARINGNDVIVRDFDGEIDSYVRAVPFAGGSGTKHYTLPQTNRSNIIAAATFTLARWPQITGETFELNDRCDPNGNQCCDCANSDGIWINRRTRKFLISHEVGHRLLALHTNGYNNDCTMVVMPATLPCAQNDSNSHALTSLEFSSCAAMEGWAHFVGVRAYNDPTDGNDPGATFQYWGGSGTTVDVEQGPTGGVDQYYESICGGNAANADGRGVELDWLRHWWDYHTDPSPQTPVSQQRMMDEIAQRSNWINTTAYQTISDGVEALSGADQRDRWESIAATNGVDH